MTALNGPYHVKRKLLRPPSFKDLPQRNWIFFSVEEEGENVVRAKCKGRRSTCAHVEDIMQNRLGDRVGRKFFLGRSQIFPHNDFLPSAAGTPLSEPGEENNEKQNMKHEEERDGFSPCRKAESQRGLQIGSTQEGGVQSGREALGDEPLGKT